MAMIELVDYNEIYNAGKATKKKSTVRSRRGRCKCHCSVATSSSKRRRINEILILNIIKDRLLKFILFFIIFLLKLFYSKYEISKRKKAISLADGTIFLRKVCRSKEGTAFGEVCFNTGMTGYQEIFTDPSYFGQLMVTTNAHIGNYGNIKMK